MDEAIAELERGTDVEIPGASQLRAVLWITEPAARPAVAQSLHGAVHASVVRAGPALCRCCSGPTARFRSVGIRAAP